MKIFYVPDGGKLGDGNVLHYCIFIQQISMGHMVLAFLQDSLHTLPTGRIPEALPVQ